MSLLQCSVCRSEVQVLGKHGAIFHTSCPTCGSDSGPMITAAVRRQSSEQFVQVIRKRTVPRRRINSMQRN